MEQPLGLLLAFVALLGVLFGLFASLAAFFPRHVWLARRAAEESPGRSLLLGAVNAVFILAVSLTLLALGDRQGLLAVIGGIVLAAGSSGLAVGLAGVVTMVGKRLAHQGTELSGILTGTVVLTLASATPFLGWFVFLPGVVFLGLGAFILGWYRRRTYASSI
jgi:hypothetical protein